MEQKPRREIRRASLNKRRGGSNRKRTSKKVLSIRQMVNARAARVAPRTITLEVK